MKENISDVMYQLRRGQIIIFKNKEYTFIEPKRTRALVYDKKQQKNFLIKGTVDITDDIDFETLEMLEEEIMKEFNLERKARNMTQGQCFIGTDDIEYKFVKFNKSTFDCIKVGTDEVYRCKVGFIKNILDKII